MKNDKNDIIAPEQYELHAAPVYKFNLNRRRFFQVMGSGLAIAFTAHETLGGILANENKLPEDQVGAWIHIDKNGSVTIYTGKAEVGQNIRTSLAQIVSEELGVPMSKIDMVLGDTDLTPYDRGTFGSRSIPYMGPQLRKAAATAREALIDMASKKWNVDRNVIVIENAEVKNRKTQQTLGIGKVKQFVWDAQKRGIIFDVGYGGISFSFSQAVPALKNKFYPNTISTDLHIGSMKGSMKDMLSVMSKFHHMGMDIPSLIKASTWTPATVIKREELGHLSVGAGADVAILNLRQGDFGFYDYTGYRLRGDKKFECEMTIRNGKIVYDLNGIAEPVVIRRN